MAEEVEFVEGLFVKAPPAKAPEWVKCLVSIKPAEMIAWLEARKGQEYINIDVKQSKGGKYYAAVSNFKPKEKSPAKQDNEDDGIPF